MYLFFSENCAVYEILENAVGPGQATDVNTMHAQYMLVNYGCKHW